jgi:hypothetical protein
LEIEIDVEALAAGLLDKEWNASNEESRPQSRGRHLLTLDLIDDVSRRAELTRKDSEAIVETIFESVVRPASESPHA